MLCLGVESSCDETALALVQDGHLLCDLVATQEKMHAIFGGVVPEIASRIHLQSLFDLWKQLLDTSGIRPGDVDVVAVSRGPGLLGSLLMGMGFAKGLALGLGTRFVGVDHLLAHIFAPGLEQELPLPALALLVSGGHTQLYLVRSPVDHQLLGRTLDDAAGEAFDKMAKLLNLPYPGGKWIDALGRLDAPDPDLFPVPYLDNQNLDFSFSGLKTAMANYLAKYPELRLEKWSPGVDLKEIVARRPHLAVVCSSFNQAVVKGLLKKVRRALLGRHLKLQGLIVAGGVAANQALRQGATELAQEFSLPLVLPSLPLCTDNGAMIAHFGYLLAKSGFGHDLSIDAIPRGKPVPHDLIRFSS